MATGRLALGMEGTGGDHPFLDVQRFEQNPQTPQLHLGKPGGLFTDGQTTPGAGQNQEAGIVNNQMQTLKARAAGPPIGPGTRPPDAAPARATEPQVSEPQPLRGLGGLDDVFLVLSPIIFEPFCKCYIIFDYGLHGA